MDKERIAYCLAEMIRIPTVSSRQGTEEYRIRDYQARLKELFPALFARAEVTEIGNALLLRLPGTDSSLLPVLFTGHMDVVPAEAEQWKVPPFEGRLEQDCVWGRGAIDMKGPHCTLLYAANEIAASNTELRREIYFYLSCDEETGGATTELAAEHLRKQGVRFQAVFDEGGSIGENYLQRIPGRFAELGIAEKGSLQYEFTARAEGGHAAFPPKNAAIVSMAKFIAEIESVSLFRHEITQEARYVLEGAMRLMSEPEQAQLRSAMEAGEPFKELKEFWPASSAMLGATIAFTLISGGTAFNVLPREVKLGANVRASSNQSMEEITEILTQAAARYGIECKCLSGGGASKVTSPDSWAYRTMEHCLTDVFPGIHVVPILLLGGTDSKHFQDLTEQTIRFSPVYLEPWQCVGVHGINECIYTESLARGAEFYQRLMAEYIGKE